MVTGDTSYLTTNTFLDVVVQIFPLLSVGWFTVVSHSGYLTRGNNANTHSITMNGNVSALGLAIPLVTIPFLDLVMIH